VSERAATVTPPDRVDRRGRAAGQMVSMASYRQAVQRLRRDVAALPPGAPVRLAKRTSNLFRPRARVATPRLEVGAFAGVLGIDAAGRTADVLGMTSYEQLVDATLPYGLMPLVVPQLKTITLGGAVSGLGIESTSFRNGLPHESVLEMDVLTGDGRVLTLTPDGAHADLFAGFPNSYGTLGYALRLRIELAPVRPYVHLVHERFGDAAALTERMRQLCDPAAADRPDFLDGTAFSPDELYLSVGRWADSAPRPPSDYTRTEIYYRSIQQRREDWLTAAGYLWRWDTDWFWCSRAFGVERRWLRALLGRRYLRSDTYWRIMALENRFHAKARLDRRRGLPEREAVVQDIEVRAERLPEFLAFLDAQTGMRPVWICPLRGRDARRWPLYDLDPGALWVNVGFWGTVALPPGGRDGYHNRRIEAEVSRLGGRKSLYSTSFYQRAEFDARYGGAEYHRLRTRYDPDTRLLDLYDKAVGRR
jgi:FAD/FMN-containing dehydrogenase